MVVRTPNSGDAGWVDPVAEVAGVTANGRLRVLFADDNADLRAYVTRLLKDTYEVSAVANGREALQAVRRQRPDLLISDVMMPDLDGIGLVPRDSQRRIAPRPPV